MFNKLCTFYRGTTGVNHSVETGWIITHSWSHAMLLPHLSRYQALESKHPRYMIYSKSLRKYDIPSLVGFKMTAEMRHQSKLNQKSCD